ncbi:MAG: nucleotidyltransferase domain-containing protein [Candidatus Caldarchaeum sp.]|nr:nucleotidyltransferase domain-containing protein [Candidatus Caldarchaeum sp.]MCS7137669.1 nucleotidyltransferase domain-containing protein [Candidatus Caldarchaeum sp.]MDW7978715.1 nucleotidyltransferase domain-containing protein [Candidatus Caldarchaeum sp.]MDW8358987.1 nucleotidyltransferase domain-containing protein [Candidatus Caldarchaeum sp.]
MKKKAVEKVSQFVEGLERSGLAVRCVVLFGSYARGDFTEESDMDICIVAENLGRDEAGRPRLDSPVRVGGVQPLAYSPLEFLEALRSLSPVALDIMHEGVVLRDDGFFEEARRLYEELKSKHGLVRWKDGWRWRTV